MRLWHKDLISVLPKNQLIGQWRECCAIAKAIAENGTPNHILINKIIDYPIDHFYTYCKLIELEMLNRNYKITSNSIQKIFSKPWYYINNIFPNWHNDRYLKQCYYNLQEKFDCGGISEEEWIKIKNKFEEKLNK